MCAPYDQVTKAKLCELKGYTPAAVDHNVKRGHWLKGSPAYPTGWHYVVVSGTRMFSLKAVEAWERGEVPDTEIARPRVRAAARQSAA